jgi:hypothetical protein
MPASTGERGSSAVPVNGFATSHEYDMESFDVGVLLAAAGERKEDDVVRV